MTRAINLNLTEASVRETCAALAVVISVIEKLDGGGVRLVCSSSNGAEIIRDKLRGKIISGRVARSVIRSGAMQPTSWLRDSKTAADNRAAARDRRERP